MAEFKGNLEQQIDEFELLQSMFSGPGEFQVDDEASYDQVTAFLRDLTPHTPGRLRFTVHIVVDTYPPLQSEQDSVDDTAAGSKSIQHSVDISFKLPHRYPEVLPEVYVSSNDLSRTFQDDLNTSLQEYIATSTITGDVCLLSVVEWIRDNAGGYFPIPSTQDVGTGGEECGEDSPLQFCRMWLYMHHIFSKTKRRNILSLAGELDLTGFCLPGKPGVVCVEGEAGRAKEFYSILRRWNWKSITCRKKEVVSDGDVQSHRRIDGFQELTFDTHGQRQTHMDLGQFLEYLRERKLEYMFKTLFGVEGH